MNGWMGMILHVDLTNGACSARPMEPSVAKDYTLKKLKQAGERVINAEQVFPVRAGFTAKDDTLPKRLTEESLPTGPAKGVVCHLPEMLEEYYQVQGWPEDGVPGEGILNQLDLP